MAAAPVVKILFVENNPATRSSMSLVFETIENMELIGVVDNGKEALSFCEKMQPDIAIIDLGLPKKDGVLTSRLIKKRYPGVRVVLLTGFDDGRLSRQAEKDGAKVFLPKDATIDELVAAIQKALLLRQDC